MRIATFNLESLDLPPKAATPVEERARILRPQLERLSADILCLQEINGQFLSGSHERSLVALDALLKGTRYETYERVSTLSPHGRGVTDVHNLVVLSALPIAGSREIRHERVQPISYELVTAIPALEEPARIGWDRPVLLVDIWLPDGNILTVINVHLRAPLSAPVPGQKASQFVWKSVAGWAEGYFLASLKRIGQALELRLALEALMDNAPERNIAVCGDFNADDHETALKIIIGAEEDTGNGRLAPRALIPLERSVAKDQRFTVLHYGRAQMLDHILVSRPLLAKFRQLEIHNETIEDELVGYAKVDKPATSYHAPVVAEFAFEEI